MVKYVKFLKNQQTNFLKEIKIKHNKSWDTLAEVLDISRSMVFNYLNENCKIPYERFNLLCKLFNIEKNKYKTKIIIIKNDVEEIELPQLSSQFAEFLGALAGDGHIGSTNYEVCIVCHKYLDKNYVEKHINKMYRDLFNTKPRIFIHKEKNWIKIRIYSKKLVEYLSKTFKLPVGKKKGKLKIPKQIEKSIYLKDYLRGLFDTDGSFHRHHKNKAAIEIISMDKKFLKQVYDSLKYLNFSPGISGKNLYLYRPNEIEKFFKEIKPANYKHLSKYKVYKEKGFVPLTKDMMRV